MGCVSASSRSIEEEKIKKCEEILNFHRIPLSELDVVFRKYSKNGKLNPLQFAKAGEKLGVRIRNTENCSKITKTFNKTKDDKGNYALYDLIIFSVLLSNEIPRVKSQILYQLIDNDFKGSVSERDVKKLVSDMIRFSVDISCGLVDDDKSEEYNKIVKYVQELNFARGGVVCKIVEAVMLGNNEVGENKFCERISSCFQGKFLSSCGVRETLVIEALNLAKLDSRI